LSKKECKLSDKLAKVNPYVMQHTEVTKSTNKDTIYFETVLKKHGIDTKNKQLAND